MAKRSLWLHNNQRFIWFVQKLKMMEAEISFTRKDYYCVKGIINRRRGHWNIVPKWSWQNDEILPIYEFGFGALVKSVVLLSNFNFIAAISRANQDDGQFIRANGNLKTVESPDGPKEIVVINGRFSWVDPLGVEHSVSRCFSCMRAPHSNVNFYSIIEGYLHCRWKWFPSKNRNYHTWTFLWHRDKRQDRFQRFEIVGRLNWNTTYSNLVLFVKWIRL